jgi:2-polyprenyl-3-methyl-5-hydroxy-6-metoxy-1,4-benzoquinol methylase
MKPKTYQEPVKHPRTDRGAREFDQSSLRTGSHGRYVHRDYAAHWFRWQHALRFIKAGMRVLDIGCGPDQMMTRVLCASQSHVPALYVGVDMNKLEKKTAIAWTTIIDEFDFTKRWRELFKIDTAKEWGKDFAFDVITCFEVLEHMPKAQGAKLLKGIRECLAPGGTALMSTPVYNEKHMAANHLHEYRFEELKEDIDKAGLVVDRVVGTFATHQAMMKNMSNEHRDLVNLLHETWFSHEVLACFLAPLYPEHSSNCCWILSRT